MANPFQLLNNVQHLAQTYMENLLTEVTKMEEAAKENKHVEQRAAFESMATLPVEGVAMAMDQFIQMYGQEAWDHEAQLAYQRVRARSAAARGV